MRPGLVRKHLLAFVLEANANSRDVREPRAISSISARVTLAAPGFSRGEWQLPFRGPHRLIGQAILSSYMLRLQKAGTGHLALAGIAGAGRPNRA
jgi:hypothetical protein